MVTYDKAVRDGTVVTSEGERTLDIGIRNGQIATLGTDGDIESADHEIDADGMYVFPGFIDAHVHVKIPLGEFVTRDDFDGVTRAAALGGTTTIIDFAIPDPDETSLENFERKREHGEELSFVDFGLHGCVTTVDEVTLEEIPTLIEQGAGSVKMFMVYRDRLFLDNGQIHRAMQAIEAAGGLALVHAEDQAVIEGLVDDVVSEGDGGYESHPDTHPEMAETIAMWTIAEIVAETGCPTYFVHASSRSVTDVMEYARDNRLPLLAETCPHYLTLSEEVYLRDDGERYVCSPPIRPDNTADALWEMVQSGLIQTVNSDHCGYDTEQKRQYRDDLTKIPNGLPGVETKNTVLFSEGVVEGRLSPERFVNLVSTNAAKMLGIYPRKGTIAVGSDADIVVFDPTEEWTVEASGLGMETDYSPFEGSTITGRPHTVLSRGETVVSDGTLVGESGHGTFIETSGDGAAAKFERRLQ